MERFPIVPFSFSVTCDIIQAGNHRLLKRLLNILKSVFLKETAVLMKKKLLLPNGSILIFSFSFPKMK